MKEILVLSMWPEQNNKITDQVSLGQHITKEEVKEALRKMKSDKAVGPNSIPVEVWKSLGEDEVAWLTDFFNVIFTTAKCHKNGDIVQSFHYTRMGAGD